MSKFICSNCNIEYEKWIRVCRNCNESRSIIENKISVNNINIHNHQPSEKLNIDLPHITNLTVIKRNSIYVIGGEPGIGKSTLIAQICLKTQNSNILYTTGEESVDSVTDRIIRINKNNNEHSIDILYVIYIEQIREVLKIKKYDILIIDSMQTLKSNKQSGVLYVCDELRNVAIEFNIAIILTSHITKDGIIAGPKTIEHMVDVVFYLEGDRYNIVRTLRSVKNRFGSTNDYSMFEMTENGLVPISDFERFISKRSTAVCGSVLCPVLTNGHIIMIELHSLLAKDPQPRIEVCGYNVHKIRMLIGVLLKWCKMNIQFHTVYINIVSGIKIEECCIELSICASIISSYYNISIPDNILFFGEVSLTGEIIYNEAIGIKMKNIPNIYVLCANTINITTHKQIIIKSIYQLYEYIIQLKNKTVN